MITNRSVSLESGRVNVWLLKAIPRRFMAKPTTAGLLTAIEVRNKPCDGMNSPAIQSVMQMPNTILGDNNHGRFGVEANQQTSAIKSPLSSFKTVATKLSDGGRKMGLNLFMIGQAEPLDESRFPHSRHCCANVAPSVQKISRIRVACQVALNVASNIAAWLRLPSPSGLRSSCPHHE
jgi:hypothetical protein